MFGNAAFLLPVKPNLFFRHSFLLSLPLIPVSTFADTQQCIHLFCTFLFRSALYVLIEKDKWMFFPSGKFMKCDLILLFFMGCLHSMILNWTMLCEWSLRHLMSLVIFWYFKHSSHVVLHFIELIIFIEKSSRFFSALERINCIKLICEFSIVRPPLCFQEKVLGAEKDDYRGNDRENEEYISNVCKIFHIW